jgi:hypothetical protein
MTEMLIKTSGLVLFMVGVVLCAAAGGGSHAGRAVAACSVGLNSKPDVCSKVGAFRAPSATAI